MALMCEECKCSITLDSGCSNGCSCCNKKMSNKELATQLIKAIESSDTNALYGIALELLKEENSFNRCRSCNRIEENLFHHLCNSCYYGTKGAN
jgi:hypothetical protein